MSSKYRDELIEAALEFLLAYAPYESPDCQVSDRRRRLKNALNDALAALPPASPAPARVEVEPIAGGAGAVVTNAYPVGGYFDPKPRDPAPKGVRCWRSATGFLGDDPTSVDRVREGPDGKLEWVQNDGAVYKTYDRITDYSHKLTSGEWVECDDAPYVAPVVKESLTTAPPVAAPAPAMIVCTCNAPHRQSFDGEVHCTRCGRRIPPTPTEPRETAEQVAERIRCTTTRKGECDIINADRAVMQAEVEKMQWERDIATEDRLAQNREFQQLTTELGIPVETTYAQGIRRFIGGLKDKIDAQQVTIGRAAQDINDANSLRKGYELDLRAAKERMSDMDKIIYRQRERISTLMHDIDELKVGNSLMSERIGSQEHTAAILRADLESAYSAKAKLIDAVAALNETNTKLTDERDDLEQARDLQCKEIERLNTIIAANTPAAADAAESAEQVASAVVMKWVENYIDPPAKTNELKYLKHCVAAAVIARDYKTQLQPTRSAMESVEAVAGRCVEVCGGSKYSIGNVADVLAARDATWQAEVDAAKALIAHNVEVIAAKDEKIADTMQLIDHARKQVDGYERRVDDLMKALTAAESRLAEREAGGGEWAAKWREMKGLHDALLRIAEDNMEARKWLRAAVNREVSRFMGLAEKTTPDALSVFTESYIRSLSFSPDAGEYVKTLIVGNIRAFSAAIRLECSGSTDSHAALSDRGRG